MKDIFIIQQFQGAKKGLKGDNKLRKNYVEKNNH